MKNRARLTGVSGWRDGIEYVVVSFNHSSSNLTLKFTSNLNEHANNESFGFSDLEITWCNESKGRCWGEPGEDKNKKDKKGGKSNVLTAINKLDNYSTSGWSTPNVRPNYITNCRD